MNTEDMSTAINTPNDPTKDAVLWVLRTFPITLVIAALLLVAHAVGGDIEALRATWGHDPRKAYSLFTHPFIHTDDTHLIKNLLFFLPSSLLIELYIGSAKLAAIILFTTVAAAGTSGIAVREYWDTNSNPVGFSAVVNATLVLGAYMVARIIAIQTIRVLTATPILKIFQDWPWATIGTAAGVMAAGIWLYLAIGNEWTNQDLAPRIAHSFGMITGGTIAVLIAITIDRKGNHTFCKSDTILAIVASIIALGYWGV